MVSMKRRHREALRRIEAESLLREIRRKKMAYESGRQVREYIGIKEGRKLLTEIHTLELAACSDPEIRPLVEESHRFEMDGLEGNHAEPRLSVHT